MAISLEIDTATAELFAETDRSLIRFYLSAEARWRTVREMRNKWGSISTSGTLTLADSILGLPLDLAEYVVVHELLHLKFPDHRQGWQVSMGMVLPDWREREQRLQAYVASDGAEKRPSIR